MSLDRETLFAEIAELVKLHSTDPNATFAEATQLEELGLDSIDLMEIVFRLEETHGAEISISGLAGKNTLGEVVDYALNQINS
ncbi:phosphopantetheine-binding protein [Roseicyclus amphidinii]|uniref:phosphopantetheine-binding protein n=1 Tax=Roseicyclus amphidinii TaxID=3034232 RepID=UPI0024E0557F|nr:phosphopantetheine-binding protein [Roseicyclus sp. Amp-Y-6]